MQTQYNIGTGVFFKWTIIKRTVHGQVEVSSVRSDWVARNTGVLRGVSLFYTADLQDGLDECHPVYGHQLLVDSVPGTIAQGSATSTPRDGRCRVTWRNTHEHSRAASSDCSAVRDDDNPRSICVSIQTESKGSRYRSTTYRRFYCLLVWAKARSVAHVRTHASTRKATGDIFPPPVSLIFSSSLFTIHSLHTPSTTCLLRGSKTKKKWCTAYLYAAGQYSQACKIVKWGARQYYACAVVQICREQRGKRKWLKRNPWTSLHHPHPRVQRRRVHLQNELMIYRGESILRERWVPPYFGFSLAFKMVGVTRSAHAS